MSMAEMLIESMMHGGYGMYDEYDEIYGGYGGYSDYMDSDEDHSGINDGYDSNEEKEMFKTIEDHIFKGYVQCKVGIRAQIRINKTISRTNE